MKIINGLVYTENFVFENKDFNFEGEYITEDSDGELLDVKGDMIIPGLIDLHFHGCAGFDFCDGTQEALSAIAKYQAENGTTAMCPASMPDSREKLFKAFNAAREYNSNDGALLVGINMEGPFLSKEKIGGCDENYIEKIDIDLYNQYNTASGDLIKIVDVAPDLDNALEFIEQVSKTKVVSLAHTPADYVLAKKAFEKGASHVTHLFNACAPFAHRDTGLVGAALDCGAMVELIGDGAHISDPMIRATFKMFGESNIVLISDSILAAGLSDGDYMMGELKITVKNKLAYLEDGTIAGSASNLFNNLKHTVSCGISPESAIKTATYNPASVLGVLDNMGTLEIGKLANFLIVDKDFNLKSVYIKGRKIYEK